MVYPSDIIQIKEGYLWVDGEKIPLLSGEFHFWRNNKKFWPRILDSIKDLGFKHITTYVEWAFHRITPDGTPVGQIKYDFRGVTDQQCDLEGYLSLLDKRKDFWLSIRPGPYIYAETEFGGPPAEAEKYHRNHPRFLELAEDYIKHVSEVIKPHLVTNGGRIIFCQLDNESSMIKYANQVLDLPVEDPCSFKAFVKQKYGDWEEAARVYGMEKEWASWDDVAPMPALPMNEKEFLLYLDTAEYLEYYNAVFFRQIADMYTKYGINVPFYINSTGPPFPHNPEMLDSFVDLRTADIYYLNKEKLINMLTLNAKLLKSNSPAVVAGEFRCGTFTDFIMNDLLYKYQALLWMGYGYHGVNYFMIVERHRWANTPIDAVGRPYVGYNAFKSIIQGFHRIDYPRFTNHSVADISLIWYRPHIWANKHAPLEPGYEMETDFNNEHIYKSLLWANVPFDIWYPGSPYSSIDQHPYLIYAGHDFLEPNIAHRILEYIKNGGTVIFYYNYPTRDIRGDKLGVFDDYLIQPSGMVRVNRDCAINVGTKTIATPTVGLLNYDVSEKDGKYILFKYKHMNVGYVCNIGKGRAIVTGFDLNPVAIVPFLESLGWSKPCSIGSTEVLGNLFHIKESNEILFSLINPTEKAIKTAVNLNFNKLQISKSSSGKWQQELVFEQKVTELNDLNHLEYELPANSGFLVYIKQK